VSTDSEIIRRSIGEPRAFAEIFERHATAVGRFAARRIGPHPAEDVVSETFLVAFRRRADFDVSWESARPWLLGIASRTVKHHRAKEAAQWRAYAAAVGRTDGVAHDDVEAADDRADAASLLSALSARIAALPRRDRDTLLLYAWGDLTYEEIGRALGVPTGTVRSRLNRVRRVLGGLPPVPRASGVRRQEREEGEVDGPVGSRA